MRDTSWVDTETGRWALALVLQWARDLGLVGEDDASDHWVALASRSARARYSALRALGPLRTMARQVVHDASTPGRAKPPSYWRAAEVLQLPGGRWEARVGWCGTVQQVGEWPSRSLALEALRALRPGVTPSG